MVSTLPTPSIFAASAATAPTSAASTSTSIDPALRSFAQVTQRAVLALSLPSRCSAMMRTLLIDPYSVLCCCFSHLPLAEEVRLALLVRPSRSFPHSPAALLAHAG